MFFFGKFEFEPNKLILKYNDRVLNESEPGASKTRLQVLRAILLGDGEVVTYDEIKAGVWPGDETKTSDNISPHVTGLNNLFRKFEPECDYIKNSPRIGYRFDGARRNSNDEPVPPGRKRSTLILAASIIVFLLVCGLAWWYLGGRCFSDPSPIDEAELRRVVEQSQRYETLTLYQNPEAFDERALDEYWMNNDQGSDVRNSIRRSVSNLVGRRQHYGAESKAEKFDFIEIRVSCGLADRARVLVHERWFLPLYDAEGVEIRNRNVYLEKTNEYYLRKIGGRWLLEKTSTPYAKPSPMRNSASTTN